MSADLEDFLLNKHPRTLAEVPAYLLEAFQKNPDDLCATILPEHITQDGVLSQSMHARSNIYDRVLRDDNWNAYQILLQIHPMEEYPVWRDGSAGIGPLDSMLQHGAVECLKKICAKDPWVPFRPRRFVSKLQGGSQVREQVVHPVERLLLRFNKDFGRDLFRESPTRRTLEWLIAHVASHLDVEQRRVWEGYSRMEGQSYLKFHEQMKAGVSWLVQTLDLKPVDCPSCQIMGGLSPYQIRHEEGQYEAQPKITPPQVLSSETPAGIKALRDFRGAVKARDYPAVRQAVLNGADLNKGITKDPRSHIFQYMALDDAQVLDLLDLGLEINDYTASWVSLAADRDKDGYGPELFRRLRQAGHFYSSDTPHPFLLDSSLWSYRLEPEKSYSEDSLTLFDWMMEDAKNFPAEDPFSKSGEEEGEHRRQWRENIRDIMIHIGEISHRFPEKAAHYAQDLQSILANLPGGDSQKEDQERLFCRHLNTTGDWDHPPFILEEELWNRTLEQDDAVSLKFFFDQKWLSPHSMECGSWDIGEGSVPMIMSPFWNAMLLTARYSPHQDSRGYDDNIRRNKGECLILLLKHSSGDRVEQNLHNFPSEIFPILGATSNQSCIVKYLTQGQDLGWSLQGLLSPDADGNNFFHAIAERRYLKMDHLQFSMRAGLESGLESKNKEQKTPFQLGRYSTLEKKYEKMRLKANLGNPGNSKKWKA